MVLRNGSASFRLYRTIQKQSPSLPHPFHGIDLYFSVLRYMAGTGKRRGIRPCFRKRRRRSFAFMFRHRHKHCSLFDRSHHAEKRRAFQRTGNERRLFAFHQYCLNHHQPYHRACNPVARYQQTLVRQSGGLAGKFL